MARKFRKTRSYDHAIHCLTPCQIGEIRKIIHRLLYKTKTNQDRKNVQTVVITFVICKACPNEKEG